MGNLLYILAIFLVVAWTIGYFETNVGGIIHILLVIAAIALVMNVTQGQNVAWNNNNRNE